MDTSRFTWCIPTYLLLKNKIEKFFTVSWDGEGEEKSENNDSSSEKEKQILNEKSAKCNNRGETKAVIHAPPVRGKERKLIKNCDRVRKLGEEKETSVEKLPSGDSADYAIDDIKFADDDEDENRMENSIV